MIHAPRYQNQYPRYWNAFSGSLASPAAACQERCEATFMRLPVSTPTLFVKTAADFYNVPSSSRLRIEGRIQGIGSLTIFGDLG